MERPLGGAGDFEGSRDAEDSSNFAQSQPHPPVGLWVRLLCRPQTRTHVSWGGPVVTPRWAEARAAYPGVARAKLPRLGGRGSGPADRGESRGG